MVADCLFCTNCVGISMCKGESDLVRHQRSHVLDGLTLPRRMLTACNLMGARSRQQALSRRGWRSQPTRNPVVMWYHGGRMPDRLAWPPCEVIRQGGRRLVPSDTAALPPRRDMKERDEIVQPVPSSLPPSRHHDPQRDYPGRGFDLISDREQ
ncbi:hypothetical protein EJ03DRAFT_193949 [Teratosphaeria nubilosa]|uniref:Uncharacterized protein n=1 Tax=Teratosphaeria nubilosa TaxID=161662 RepID=A0A6G1KZB4_9PEZI|nr:hypothetical protein EJ03DRAFT_193949 [Teratosphaeria nubilosa]